MREGDVLIVGLGETGFSVARRLAATATPFSVVDSRVSPPKLDALAAECPDAMVHTGAFDAELFRRASQIVLSPGVSMREAAVRAAMDAGVPVVGDIELFARTVAPSDKVLTVTGSNGKSSVCRLLADMAAASGRCAALGGNYGRPALDLLDAEEPPELYVLELSSFQLETTRSLRGHIAVLLNITADHLDRYDSMDDYARAKMRIFRSCDAAVFERGRGFQAPDAGRVVSFGMDEPEAGHFGVVADGGGAQIACGDEPWLPVSDLPLPGRHGQLNVMAALAAGLAAGLPKRGMLEAVRAFTGLPHRLEFVGAYRGARWINDSKATNVAAAISALESLEDACIWIGGGSDKAGDYGPLREVLRRRAHRAVVYGRAARKIADAVGDAVPVAVVKTLAEAVDDARKHLRERDTVLLSPACASLDQYADYRERGEHFAALAAASEEKG